MGIESADDYCEWGRRMPQGMLGTRAGREETPQLIGSWLQEWPKGLNLRPKTDRGARHPDAAGENGILLRWQRVRVGVASS
jgi:hypothetical protein